MAVWSRPPDHLIDLPSKGLVLPEALTAPYSTPSPRLSRHHSTQTPTSQAHRRGTREARSIYSMWSCKGERAKEPVTVTTPQIHDTD